MHSNVRAVSSVIAPHLCGTVLDSERIEPARKRPSRKKPMADCTLTHTSTQPTSLLQPFSLPLTTSLDDSLTFMLEAFDSLIAPQIPHPLDSSASNIALRRCLYRKQFNLEAFKQIHSLLEPITSVEQLIPIINSSCVKCGILLI